VVFCCVGIIAEEVGKFKPFLSAVLVVGIIRRAVGRGEEKSREFSQIIQISHFLFCESSYIMVRRIMRWTKKCSSSITGTREAVPTEQICTDTGPERSV